jgi:hypothetical protein
MIFNAIVRYGNSRGIFKSALMSARKEWICSKLKDFDVFKTSRRALRGGCGIRIYGLKKGSLTNGVRDLGSRVVKEEIGIRRIGACGIVGTTTELILEEEVTEDNLEADTEC